MKIEIPDKYINNWKSNLERAGYDPPINTEEWVQILIDSVEKELGEDQFDFNKGLNEFN